MRRNDKEIKDPALIEQILSTSEVCRIGLLDGDRPYIVPMMEYIPSEMLSVSFVFTTLYAWGNWAIAVQNPAT